MKRARNPPQVIWATLLVIASFANTGAESIAGTAIGSGQLDASTFKSYEDGAGVVVRLSNERDLPFLFLGKVPDRNHLRYHTYRRPVARFPDVGSCLVEKERNSEKPDLTAFDWKLMGDTNQAEVCIHRIATSYRDPEAFEAWLASQKFEPIGRIEGMATGDPKLFIIYADWSVNRKGVLLGLGNYIARKFTELFSYTLHVSVSYKENVGVTNVQVSYLKN